MWEQPYISIFAEIGALQNFMHFGGHLKNGCQDDRHFEIAKIVDLRNVIVTNAIYKKAAIAAIMVAILASIFNMVAKTHEKFRSAPITKKIDI
jgi:hypothetical protein